jgi:alpha-L-rhamnosidase
MNFRTFHLHALQDLVLICMSFAFAGNLAFAQPSWITTQKSTESSTSAPCPIMRSSFVIDGEPNRATVRVIGLGHYLLSLNGQHVGNSLIDQPWSQYNKTLYWQEFDIQPLLKKGENAWGVLLGNSFWKVGPANDTTRYVKTDAMPDFSHGYPFLLWLEAKITMKDGKVVTVTSDRNWKWTEGPLTFSNIYAGEDYDARRLPTGWDAPGFNDRMWRNVQVAPAPSGAKGPFTAPPIKAFEVFRPERIVTPDVKGEYTYVFPQNCSALLRFTVDGSAGKTIRFRPCEFMDSTGRVKFTYTWGTKKDIWHDYTLRGSGQEQHQILFCYVGCQYVGVTGAVPEGYPNPGGLPVLRSLELVHVRAACPEVGFFTCSSDLQNGAYRLIDWSIRSNLSYVATDCPHREKNGWQEQTWHMARAFSYRFNAQSFYEKIAHDIRDTQLPDGHVPTNCPNYLVGVRPHGYWNEAPEWGISSVLVPWHLYEWYGDRKALAAAFESMRRYVDYLSSQAIDGVISSNLGDWYDYGHGKGDGPSQWTPNQASATAIWALGARTVAQAAGILGKSREEAVYEKLWEKIKADFQRRFYDPQRKSVLNHGSCQAINSTALCVGLIPEEDRMAVLQAIVDDVERWGYQQTVGEVLQVFFVRALAEGGRNDVLHKVYARENRGSYGYMVRQGLTTLPESWDARPGTGNSMNHFMLGHLMEWQFAYVAGIRQQPGGVGWRRILIAPNPGPLDSASASFNSPTGLIKVHWEKKDKQFQMSVTIPSGVEAEAVLPNGETVRLKEGMSALKCAL